MRYLVMQTQGNGDGVPHTEEQMWKLQKMHLEAKGEIQTVLFGKLALETKGFCPFPHADKTQCKALTYNKAQPLSPRALALLISF